jgi:hypothetical protein
MRFGVEITGVEMPDIGLERVRQLATLNLVVA